MGLLDSTSQKFLVESMRHALIDSVKTNKTLKESVANEGIKFVGKSATYEQLLNMTMNPLRESKYLPAHVLEGAVAILAESLYSGRRIIGINAITEGAMNLVKKTGCIVTEAMMDAALNASKGKGLQVVAESIKLIHENAKTDSDAMFKAHEAEKKLQKALANKDSALIAKAQAELKAAKAVIGSPDQALSAKKAAKTLASKAEELFAQKQGAYQKALSAAKGNAADPAVVAAKTEFSNARVALKKANNALAQANAKYNRVLKFFDLSRETVTGKNGKTVGKWVKGYSGGSGSFGNIPAEGEGVLSKVGSHFGKHYGKYALGTAALGAGYLGLKKWLQKKQAEKEMGVDDGEASPY